MADLAEFGVPDLLASLSPDLREALARASVSVRYSDGQLIHARNDGVQSLSIIRSGAARIGQFDADGTYSGVAILGPGQFFGEFTLFADLPRRFDAIASGPTVVDEINQTRFERLLDQHRGIRSHFLASLAHRLHAALEVADEMRRLPLKVRVAKTLHMMRTADHTKEPLKVTQSDLGDLLGVTRVSINKALSSLEDEALIARAYGRIDIPDLPALSQWISNQTLPVPIGI